MSTYINKSVSGRVRNYIQLVWQVHLDWMTSRFAVPVQGVKYE